MAASRPVLSPPTSFPVLKQDPVVKPNPHPYAIRTTSTGVLTRSNSSGHNTAASKHHYVPMPTSPTRKREARLHHKHSKSLNTQEADLGHSAPQPLPVPSRFFKKASQEDFHAEEPHPVRRRAETLPPTLTSATVSVAPVEADNLPTNPKLWTPSQLASYLRTALQAQNADIDETATVPASCIPNIAKFIQDTRINGRIFLRMNEEDMTSMNIDVSWREALLAASRNLRQNILKGRIWGAGQDLPQAGALNSSLPSQPFSPLYDSYSSASSAELTTDEEDLGFSKRRKVRGRVRGLVESFERSGSFSSASDMDDEDAPPLGRATVKKWLGAKAVPEEALVLSPASPTKEPVGLGLTEGPSSLPLFDPADEPSVEALLAETEEISVGARAWEEFDMDVGVTVKHVADPVAHADAGLAADKKARSNPRDAAAKRKQERRIVTAVFAPSPSGSLSPAESQIEPSMVYDQAVQVDSGSETNAALAAATADLQETRVLVEELKQRLQDAEARNAELEKLVASQEHELAKSKEAVASDAHEPRTQDDSKACPHCGTSRSTDDRPDYLPSHSAPSLLTFGTSFLPTAVKLALPAALRPQGATPHRRKRSSDDGEPSSIAEVPQYVLLVGLGVCVVVLRLMLKKAASRRS